MSDQQRQEQAAIRGDKARRILETEEWKEAWNVYEARILDEFKACKSDDVSRMQQLKMLHLAGVAAKSHLESLVANGEFAKKDLEFKERESRMKRVVRAFK